VKAAAAKARAAEPKMMKIGPPPKALTQMSEITLLTSLYLRVPLRLIKRTIRDWRVCGLVEEKGRSTRPELAYHGEMRCTESKEQFRFRSHTDPPPPN
jgi:hypothetical protein